MSHCRTTWLLLPLLLTLGGCSGAPQTGPDNAMPITALLGGASAGDYAQAVPGRPLRLPDDHGAHPRYHSEWWYFTGNLDSQDGRHYGFQLAFFRFGLGAGEQQRTSPWATRNAWMAHFAITDTANSRLIATERFARQALGLAGASATPFSVWVQDWSASETTDAGAPFAVQLRAESERVGLELLLAAAKPAVAHGEQGLDRKGPDSGQASYYYSFSRLLVDGRVRVDGVERPVRGNAWMDHEWSSAPLDEELQGWDWFALQLTDGRELMFYRLRRADGGTSPYSAGALIDAAGRSETLAADEVSIEALAHWRSPETGARYPTTWRLSVPDRQLELLLEPYVDAQELDLSVRYWEGAARVGGRQAGTPLEGTAYVELTGY